MSTAGFSQCFELRCSSKDINPCISIERSAKAAVVAGNFVEQLNEKNAAFINELRGTSIDQLQQMRLPGLRDVSEPQLREFCLTLSECKALVELHVSQSRLNAANIGAILDAMPCQKLKRVELLGCGLGTNVINQLLTLVNRSHALEELKLSDNKFTAKDLQIVFQALRERIRTGTRLKTLHVGGNPLGVDGFRALQQSFRGMISLTSLGLRGTDLNPEALKELAELLRCSGCGVSDLQLRQNPIGAGLCKYVADRLSENTSLRVLELQQTGLDQKALSLLADAFQNHKELRALNLSKNAFGDGAAEPLGRLIACCRNLTTLQLDHTNLTSVGVVSMFQIVNRLNVKPALAGLSLAGNRIDSAGVLLLGQAAGKGQLTSLDLSENAFNADAFIMFVKQVISEGGGKLRHLDLSGNSLGDKAGPSIEELLLKLPSLQRLYLTDCALTDVAGHDILRGVSQNNTLVQLQYGGQTKGANQISKPLRQLIDQRLRQNQECTAPLVPPTELEEPPGLFNDVMPIVFMSLQDMELDQRYKLPLPSDNSLYSSELYDLPRILSQGYYRDPNDPFGYDSSGHLDDLAFRYHTNSHKQVASPNHSQPPPSFQNQFMPAPNMPPEKVEPVQFQLQMQPRKKFSFKDRSE